MNLIDISDKWGDIITKENLENVTGQVTQNAGADMQAGCC